MVFNSIYNFQAILYIFTKNTTKKKKKKCFKEILLLFSDVSFFLWVGLQDTDQLS